MKRTVGIVVLLVLALALLGGCSGGSDSAGVGTSASGEAAPEPDAGGGSAEPVSDKAADSPGLPSVGSKIVRTASLSLTVAPGEFEDAVTDARTAVTGLGGFVASSETQRGGEGEPTRGSFVVRVPADAYDRALRRLGDLGRVQSREEHGDDRAAEYVDLEARARHLEAVERQLLALLARADSVQAALAVQSQLDSAQLELEQARGRLRLLDDQVAYATIALSLRERPAAVPATGTWAVADAAVAGARAFVTVAGWTLVGLAAAAPFALLALAGFFGYRVARRRLATR